MIHIRVHSTAIAVIGQPTIEVKVGDHVIVRGPYAASAYDTHAGNTAAQDWSRRVLRILPGKNFPVLFGDDRRNATGWIKPENLQFVRRGTF